MSSHAYLPNLSVHTAALGLGLSAASFFVFGNIGVTRMGLMQVNKPSQRARFGIRPEQALQFWEYTYDLGIRHFAPTGGVALLSFLAAIYTTERDRVRTFVTVAAGCYMLVPVWTFAAVMPLNKHMKVLLRMAEKRSGKPSTPEFSSPADAEDALRSMERWKVVHNVRTVIAVVGWAAAMAAVLFL